jgi:L-rhamnose-H+ transport protein
MLAESVVPFLGILFGSFFLGTFGLGLKHVSPLRWEAWWFVYSLVGMLIFPWTWAILAVPDLFTVLAQSAGTGAIFWGALFGFLWGIGGITFGLSVESIGMALTYGIVMGLSTAVGSLVPLMRQGGLRSGEAAQFVAVAVAIMLAGVAVISFAGVKRERAGQTSSKSGNFGKGLAVVLVSGVMSSLIAIGFDFAAPIADKAKDLGITSPQVSLARWAVVCAGAFCMNAGYCLFLVFRNRSWTGFAGPGTFKAYGWAALTGGLWFASFGVSGPSMQAMGRLGLSIGWSMMLGLALITSTLWSVSTGEWKNAARPFRIMIAGLLIVIAAICVLGYSKNAQTADARPAHGAALVRSVPFEGSQH